MPSNKLIQHIDWDFSISIKLIFLLLCIYTIPFSLVSAGESKQYVKEVSVFEEGRVQISVNPPQAAFIQMAFCDVQLDQIVKFSIVAGVESGSITKFDLLLNNQKNSEILLSYTNIKKAFEISSSKEYFGNFSLVKCKNIVQVKLDNGLYVTPLSKVEQVGAKSERYLLCIILNLSQALNNLDSLTVDFVKSAIEKAGFE